MRRRDSGETGARLTDEPVAAVIDWQSAAKEAFDGCANRLAGFMDPAQGRSPEEAQCADESCQPLAPR